MEIDIGVTIKVNEDKYNIDLSIPTNITPQNPCRFIVSQSSTGGTDDLLHVAFSDKKHVYVQTQPSQKLLESAKINEYIENLHVVIEEGSYNTNGKRFANDDKTNKLPPPPMSEQSANLLITNEQTEE